MPKYGVTLPIAGHAWLEVDAESEEAAIEAAHKEVTASDIESWETLDKVVEGNVCYAPTWISSAALIE